MVGSNFRTIVLLTFFLFIFLSVHKCCSKRKKENFSYTAIMQKIKGYNIFFTFKEIMKSYYDTHVEDKLVSQAIGLFLRKCQNYENTENPKQQYPFIIVEDIKQGVRSIFGRKVAIRMKARLISNPPSYMIEMINSQQHIIEDINARRVLFAVGNYASACQARDSVNIGPVVVIKHWLDQMAFTLSKTYGTRIPPASSKIYRWPKDMFKPNLVVFFNPPVMEEGLTFDELKPLIVQMYRRFKDVKIVEVNTTTNYESATQEAIKLINKELGTIYDPYPAAGEIYAES